MTAIEKLAEKIFNECEKEGEPVTKEEALAKAKEALGSKLDGKTILKEIFVAKKIINIVAK